ncbi:MAG: SDR family NAD(P)-dependent oxidoreductase, partial [Acidobacteriaceae bacterium]|nr:SDR family NAD(P)-dependent oxidoreductase [Acidobacteriaceae bacterium]
MTGASRGIGAETATKLALRGSDLVVNYRNKSARADQICQQIESHGRKAIAIKADLTIDSELDAMMSTIQQVYKRLDVLVLNASGGLEQGKVADYAMILNHTAQLQTARAATK